MFSKKFGVKLPIHGPVVEWLQFHPVTVRDTGSNPVGTAKWIKRVVATGKVPSTTLMQMSYNGHYSFLPSRRRRFDSSHLLKLSISSVVELSTVNRAVLGSNPRYPANKETTPEVMWPHPDSREVKLPDGCVTPWVIMIKNDTSLPKFAK